MTANNHTGSSLGTTTQHSKGLVDRIDDLDECTSDLLCLYQFYLSALYALAKEEDMPRDKEWLYGFFQFNQLIEQQGKKLAAYIQQVKALAPCN